MFFQTHRAKSQIFMKDWPKFIKQNLILYNFDKSWSDILQLDQQDVNLSSNSFLGHMNTILDEHAPLKQFNKCKSKFESKPWLTPASEKSVSVNNLLKKIY